MNPLQSEIEAKGQEIFVRMEGATPHAFSRRNLTGRLLEWSMRNEALKVQLFRLVDVLPSLTSSAEVAQHATDYLGDGHKGLPRLVRWGVRLSPRVPWLAAMAAQRGVSSMSRNFILASTPAAALPVLRAMRERPIAFTADLLGETVVSEIEAERYQQRYLDLIDTLANEAEKWSLVEQIDRDSARALPKANVSVKISALYSQIQPADPETALQRLSERLMPLLLRAQQRGVFINFDMEHTAVKELTLMLFKRLLLEPALQAYEHAGIAIQAYLRDAERDLKSLIQWVKRHNRRITVRLIKGAYWDHETILARQRHWPVPVFEHKAETDANYERLARLLLENRSHIDCAFGTHSVRSIASCIVQAEQLGLSPRDYEIQMLYGMAEPTKKALIDMGHRVREYCPIGEVLPGMSYLVRRLLENTSNEGFLRATYGQHVSPEELLGDPEEVSHEPAGEPAPVIQVVTEPAAPFENAPLTDFTHASRRTEMRTALQKIHAHLGQKIPLWIGGQEVWTEREIVSVNPARPSEVVGRVAQAGLEQAEAALLSARKAFPKWRVTPIEKRAHMLERAADLMDAERFELAALEVFEVGKAWTESDADVVEAIDFCRFYAQEMRRLASSRYVVPGETSRHHYVPRGVGVVIAPWNFPLAILTGMTAATLVTGNCALVKPSGQSAVIAARLIDILRRAGVPPEVVQFVPGAGREIGEFLVAHPQIDLIAFTGSRETGLKIYETAGKTREGQANLKKVICEMGGKNALIIDSDADLDEAIPGVIYSAFGFQGQKCSALSRLIVLKENYESVLKRLVEACRSLRVGFPEEPGTMVGPVIDAAARDRIQDYLELGKREAELAFQGDVPEGDGYFIPPTIFTNVSPRSRLAQEEIFGPVLGVLKAENLTEALHWANETPYALTGGLYSRSPANIARAKEEFMVGNLYINRGITGAVVARHPFGGFKMSGTGTKAGGRDYLPHFMFPRTVTENRMRRGFAPEEGE